MPLRPRQKAAERFIIALATTWAVCTTAATVLADETSVHPLQLEVFINGEATNLIGAFAQAPDGSLSATRGELGELGITVPTTTAADGTVVLNRVAGLSFRYDEPSQRIHFTLPDGLRKVQRYDLRGREPHDAPRQDGYGAVLNYDAFTQAGWARDAGGPEFGSASLALDGRIFGPPGVLEQSALVSKVRGQDAMTLRLDTTWSYADTEDLVTYRAGDLITGGLAWSRPVRIGGVQIRRDFGLRPDLVTFPLPAASGSAVVPSVMDIYIDGLLVQSQSIAPGPYEVSNIPVMTGEGTARIVLRDAAGRETQTDLPFYNAPNLLRSGMFDFSVDAGFARRDYGNASASYDDTPVVSLSWRGGVKDWLTIETHVEAATRLLNGGAGALARLGQAGVLSFAGSASMTEDVSGLQGYLAYDFQARSINVHASSIRTSGTFTDLGTITANTLDLSANAPPRAIDTLSIGVPVDELQVSLGYAHQSAASGERSGVASLSLSHPVTQSGSIYVSALSDLEDRSKYGVFLGLSLQLGDTEADSMPVWGAASVSTSQEGTNATIEAGKPVEPDTDSFGWRVVDREGLFPLRSASVAWRSSSALTSGEVRDTDERTDLQLQASGALAVMGGGVFMTNRIDDAFAVVDAGVPGVRVLQENRPIGLTDDDGQILVPRLQSQGVNHLAIDPRDLPLDAEAPETATIATPRTRGGVHVSFGVVKDVKAALVILKDASGTDLPAGTQGHLEGATEPVIVGYDGQTYVRGLDEMNTLVLDLPGAPCRVTFPYVPQANSQVVIGPLTCK